MKPTKDSVMELLHAAAKVTIANADKRRRTIEPDRPIEVEDRTSEPAPEPGRTRD